MHEATPTRVPLDRPLTILAAGGAMACGLTDNGGIRCRRWPDAEGKSVTRPTELTGFIALAVGTAHACALDDAAGT